MLDTMVFDALHADDDGRSGVLEAVRERRLILFTTHVQEDQLAAIPDPVRRKALQRLPREVVPSDIAVRGVTRTGKAVYDPDDEAAVRGHRHTQDAIIAAAASARADVLVTDDRRLVEDARLRGLPVWQTAELIAWASAAGDRPLGDLPTDAAP